MRRLDYTPLPLSIKKNPFHMLKILADHTLPLLELFNAPFTLTRYSDTASLKKNLDTHEILLCRSTLPVNASLLDGTSIRCVATASSGVDHIDTTYLRERDISCFDAKGCNAHAVADYVSSTVSWLLKYQYIKHKQAGVMGMGHVGRKVSERLHDFGFAVHHYDPPRSQTEPSFQSCTLQELQTCHLICLHANLHDQAPFATRKMINQTFLNHLAPQAILVNAARGDLVDEQALLSSSIRYCTDVYLNEPEVSPSIIDYATLCTPHIAGHTIEAKKNAVIDLAKQLYAHFKQPLPEQIRTLKPIEHPRDKHQTLANQWLKHYDPSQETLALKAAQNKTQAFLTLRRAHNVRHDVNFF